MTTEQMWYAAVGYIAQGGTVDVAANNLANFWAGDWMVAGSDALEVPVYVGFSCGPAQSITIATTVPQVHPPVVTVKGSVSLLAGNWIEGNALPFTTRDRKSVV